MEDSLENLEDLLAAFVDGRATESQYAALNKILAKDPNARKRYLQYLNLNGALRIASAPGNSGELGLTTRTPRRLRPRLLLIAAAAGIAACTFILTRPDAATFQSALATHAVSAVLQSTQQVKWAPNSPSPDRGAIIGPDQSLGIISGVVMMQIGDVDVIVEGPAAFSLQDDGSVDLDSGTLVAQVPATAIGFTVRASGIDIVDMGTLFGVIVAAGGTTEVHVLQGKVEVVDPQHAKAVYLSTGEGAQVNAANQSNKIQRVHASQIPFQTSLKAAESIIDQPGPKADGQLGRVVGSWDRASASPTSQVLTWKLDRLSKDSVCDVRFISENRGKALSVSKVELIQDGSVISSDNHDSSTGIGDHLYRLWLPANSTGNAEYALRATLNNQPTSSGTVRLKQMALPSSTLVDSALPRGRNLAHQKSATVTSSRRGSSPPASITDGKTEQAGIWLANGWPQACLVDLGKRQLIDGIRLYLWRDGRSYYKYKVLVSVDKIKWKTVIDMDANTLPSHVHGNAHRIGSVEARYVKVEMLYNSNAETVSLIELQVFGK